MKVDITENRQYSILYTQVYRQDRAVFYLPDIIKKSIKESKGILGILFILKDFIEAFFGLIPDF